MNPSSKEEAHREFPCRRKVPLKSWLWLMLFACFPFLYYSMWADQRHWIYLACCITFAVMASSQAITLRKKYAAPFRVGPLRAGFRNQIGFSFANVTTIDETMDHLDVRTTDLFPFRKTRLIRHSFAPGDWDELTQLLLTRTREWAPSAKISRLADRVDSPVSPE